MRRATNIICTKAVCQLTRPSLIATRLFSGMLGACLLRNAAQHSELMSISNLRTPQRFAHDAALSGALQRELADELGRSDKPEQPKPPVGWRVEREPGKCTFTMRKTYEDEEIELFYCPKSDRSDVDNHEVIVTVTRNQETLQVDISIEEGEIVLDNIAFYPDAALARDNTAEGDAKRAELYPGPKVSELDDNVLDSFVKYLEKRGVNDELAEFITLYSFWSEQQEYEGWLDSISKFASEKHMPIHY